MTGWCLLCLNKINVYLAYDGKMVKLYVDAKLVGSSSAKGAIDSRSILNIGQRNSAIHNGKLDAFKGRIDDIQIYNRALTAEDIIRKYENGTTQSI